MLPPDQTTIPKRVVPSFRRRCPHCCSVPRDCHRHRHRSCLWCVRRFPPSRGRCLSCCSPVALAAARIGNVRSNVHDCVVTVVHSCGFVNPCVFSTDPTADITLVQLAVDKSVSSWGEGYRPGCLCVCHSVRKGRDGHPIPDPIPPMARVLTVLKPFVPVRRGFCPGGCDRAPHRQPRRRHVHWRHQRYVLR